LNTKKAPRYPKPRPKFKPGKYRLGKIKTASFAKGKSKELRVFLDELLPSNIVTYHCRVKIKKVIVKELVEDYRVAGFKKLPYAFETQKISYTFYINKPLVKTERITFKNTLNNLIKTSLRHYEQKDDYINWDYTKTMTRENGYFNQEDFLRQQEWYYPPLEVKVKYDPFINLFYR
jgi:hypothetical protein